MNHHIAPLTALLTRLMASTYRGALRAVFLAFALVAYGATPSTPSAQTEVEQLQEELASSHGESEYLARLRGAALRLAEKLAADPSKASPSLIYRSLLDSSRPRLSAGVVVPLRC